MTDQIAIRLRRPDMAPAELDIEHEMDADGTLVIEVVVGDDGVPRPTDYIVKKPQR